MLLGRPPFETTNLKETYRCIREARYSLPSSLSAQAKQLITNLLAKTPEDRPNLDLLLRHDFFTQVGHHCRPLWLSFPLTVCRCRYVFLRPLPQLQANWFSFVHRASVQSVCRQAVVIRHQISTSLVLQRASLRKLLLHFLVEGERK